MTNTITPKPRGFQPGNPGRPKGTGKSTKSKSERLFDRLMNSKGATLERILERVMVMAENGDSWAAKAILDRTFPARGRVVKLNLSGDPATAIDRVIKALDAGDVTASEAMDFINVLRARTEMVEAAAIEQRLAALESGAE